MGRLIDLVTPLHKATARKYIDRMVDDKVHCMLKAKEYEGDYWDGDRRYGYGGYKFLPGRWKPVAEGLIKTYGLKAGSKVLFRPNRLDSHRRRQHDLGCGVPKKLFSADGHLRQH